MPNNDYIRAPISSLLLHAACVALPQVAPACSSLNSGDVFLLDTVRGYNTQKTPLEKRSDKCLNFIELRFLFESSLNHMRQAIICPDRLRTKRTGASEKRRFIGFNRATSCTRWVQNRPLPCLQTFSTFLLCEKSVSICQDRLRTTLKDFHLNACHTRLCGGGGCRSGTAKSRRAKRR